MTIFDDWRDGLIPDADACRALCRNLGEVESQIAPLEAERATLREQLSYILDKLGGKASVPGFGSLELTAPAVVRGYDKKRLDALLIDLAAEAPEIVARLAQCRTESARAGSLRITRERQIEALICPRGGTHVWGIDGAHSNEYCKKCFVPRGNHDR